MIVILRFFLTILRQLRMGARKIKRIYFTTVVRAQCLHSRGRLRVNARSSVTKATELGENVNFNGMVIRGRGRVVIGDNFHSGDECLILTENHKYDGGNAIPYDSKESIKSEVVIGDNVWFGDRVIVLPGAAIEEGAIIQAGSVVVGRIAKGGIAGGHPARVFKFRDMVHYETLKTRRQFH